MRHLSNARMTPVQHTTQMFVMDYGSKQRRKELTKEQKAEQKKDRDPMFVIVYIVIAFVVGIATAVVWL